jgi:hypothetical protein
MAARAPRCRLRHPGGLRSSARAEHGPANGPLLAQEGRDGIARRHLLGRRQKPYWAAVGPASGASGEQALDLAEAASGDLSTIGT